MPVLWLALLSPVVLLLVMLSMERVERGLGDTESEGHASGVI